MFATRSIPGGTSESRALVQDIRRAQVAVHRLNRLAPDEDAAILAAFAVLTGRPAPEGLRLVPPVFSDFGRALEVGRDVFVNHGCVLNDLGGIAIGDGVLLGPNVQLLSSGHPTDPATRRSTITCARVELGAGV